MLTNVFISKMCFIDEGAHDWATSTESLSSGQPDQPPRFTKQLDDVSIDEGQGIDLKAVVVAVPPPDVLWMKDDDIIGAGLGFYIAHLL
jgi:hypothetical protein